MYIIKNVYNKLKKLSKTNPVQKKKFKLEKNYYN